MNRLQNFLDLHTGEEDKQKILENVKSNISFRGSTVWILACAIVVASVGLNVNSTAVIIGAMLISPLMGPIVGAGFSLGIYDFELLKKAAKNLVIATLVSLLVSTIYFTLSPFKETQSELLARTSPNIYDILIAFFGGLVGVIAITRVEKGNPIPGVAIATALMPPLCTAGYGLAIGNWKYFLGALFLYTINCVFICISTFLIVKYLKYPEVNHVNPKYRKQIKYTISSIIVLLIVPSVYFAYVLAQEKKYKQRVELFLNDEFTEKGFAILYQKVNYNKNQKSIELAFLNKKINKKEIQNLRSLLKKYKIENTKLLIKQDTTDIKKYILENNATEKAKENEKDLMILNLENKLKSYSYNNKALQDEISILFPEIKNISVASHIFNENTDSTLTKTIVIYKSTKNINSNDEEKLKQWLKKRIAKNNVELYRDKED
ncbi:TIGR00341 family protein [Flavobacterium polysaccharolyticum]|uniref:TIGR00341 family protein n=1 Tax=Flavobacterium polysaccharolyticum TaxID=3133148 RepID=A0ABU9NSC6_9FLAO